MRDAEYLPAGKDILNLSNHMIERDNQLLQQWERVGSSRASRFSEVMF